jgi:hypothetical protein
MLPDFDTDFDGNSTNFPIYVTMDQVSPPVVTRSHHFPPNRFSEQTDNFEVSSAQVRDISRPSGDPQRSLNSIGESHRTILPAIPLPGILQVSNDNHSQSQFTSASSSSIIPKKRAAPNDTSQPSIQLGKYIDLDMERRQLVGLPISENEFDVALSAFARAPQINSENHKKLKRLYYAIGSPESVVGLKEIVRIQRVSFAGGSNLTPTERIKVIEEISPKIAYHGLRKRCHVHQLFVDCSAEARKTSDGFINNTSQSISTMAGPQSGNPNNLEDSQISKKMLHRLYPDLIPNTKEYEKKENYVSNLRKLGERLDILVKKLDHGVLGLIPLPGDDLGGEHEFHITDNLYGPTPPTAYESSVSDSS